MLNRIYTIGHSTRDWETFLVLLKGSEIKVLADVRTLPGSGRYPHFNKENLSTALQDAGIEYIHMPSLGGRRKPDPAADETAWKNQAFRGYAHYMRSEEFNSGIDQLKEIARDRNTVIMCSEAVWWRCHRSLISDRLKAEGWEVLHILEKGKVQEHPFTSPARVVQGKLFY